MKKEIIAGLQVTKTEHTKGDAYGLTNATLPQIESLYFNLCNKYHRVENHFTSSLGGFMNWNGYFLCKEEIC